jgi:predicted transcriptional regulator
MSLTIELSPEMERQLREEAHREGRAPEEFARTVLEERLTASRRARVGGIAALMDKWLQEPPDVKETEGYPARIERETSVE